jgi:plasmid stabilization system protein ParE
MELKIYWTEFAVKELEKIFDYHHKKASYQVAKKLVDGIYNETLKLTTQPEIGQIEELLITRKQGFRYLVFKNYKIIYWIHSQKSWIEINDIFDTRQNPPKIKRTK